MYSFNLAPFENSGSSFSTIYKCYSISLFTIERDNLEKGGKIIMPPSALHQLSRMNIVYPMLFSLYNLENGRSSHCGVIEFIAEEGRVYLPYWLMKNLELDQGSLVRVANVSLPVANYSKFKPQSMSFLNIDNPKSVLEAALNNYACLTTGDLISIEHEQRTYELKVIETRPSAAVCIIECDMNVDFEEPEGFQGRKEESKVLENYSVNHEEMQYENFVPFQGRGNTLSSKRPIEQSSIPDDPNNSVFQQDVPDYNYQIGTLLFCRRERNPPNLDETVEPKEEDKKFEPFGGDGLPLVKKQKKF